MQVHRAFDVSLYSILACFETRRVVTCADSERNITASLAPKAKGCLKPFMTLRQPILISYVYSIMRITNICIMHIPVTCSSKTNFDVSRIVTNKLDVAIICIGNQIPCFVVNLVSFFLCDFTYPTNTSRCICTNWVLYRFNFIGFVIV